MAHSHELNWVAMKRSIRSGIAVGGFALLLYLFTVVITTPSLPPFYAVSVALVLNWWVILGVTLGSGVQAFLISYSRRQACNFRFKRPLAGSSGVVSAFSSLLSYFALIPVGCCGTWLYIVSFLPGILGTSLSAFLIDDSTILASLGLLIMAASVVYTYISVRNQLAARRGEGSGFLLAQ